MAKEWIDKDTGCRMIKPDSAYEYLFSIWAIGCDYDGCDTVGELKELVDELVDYANRASDCLMNGRIFPAYNESHFIDIPEEMDSEELVAKLQNNIYSAVSETWKGCDNIESISN